GYLAQTPGLSAGLHAGDAAFSLPQRWRYVTHRMAAYDPDLILFVGLYSPLIALVHAERPVLGLCAHAFAPVVPADAWLCADAARAGHVRAHGGARRGDSLASHPPSRVRERPPTPGAPRASLDLPDDKLILVTAGARLPAEITGDWAAAM